MQLAFGLSRAVPDEVTTAWGARLIAPNDLLHDRQDLVAESDGAKIQLVTWLNGGAIRGALDFLSSHAWSIPDGKEFVAYNDADGVIVANTNNSGGYIYVAGWLKPDRHEVREQAEALRAIRRETEIGRMHDSLTVTLYEIARMPITVERWHTHYGWSKAEAEKFGEGSSEVRVFAVYGDGARRELTSERAGEFEMGYGGSGPHETARAIVADREPGDRSPADLQRLVPEVFTPAGREQMTLVVEAADVDNRIISDWSVA